MAETKQCPECAEQVLAAARKCRFCGYRFDRGGGGALAGLLPGMRKERPEVTLATIIADWNVSLASGEEVRLFRLAELDGRVGYLLVTGTRLVFFADRGRSRHDKLVERSLDGISHARIRGGSSRGQLEFGGFAWEHAVRVYGRGEMQRLADLLTAHLAATTSTDSDRRSPG
jgi:Uncharacterised protein family UPF0547